MPHSQATLELVARIRNGEQTAALADALAEAVYADYQADRKES